ncbi:hypothetical protein EOD41_20555, partial [Mucilaginibacter limnophilus]
IKDLEKELADAKLKLVAYEKLIEIAEQEEGIIILKKTKPNNPGACQNLPKKSKYVLCVVWL